LFSGFRQLFNAFVFLCAGLVCFSWTSFALAQTSDSAKISSIKIEGNKNVSALVIYGHLEEKEKDPFSLRRLRLDIHNLFTMGDFKNVTVDAEPGDKPGLIALTFQVEERPVVKKIAFVGNKKWDAKKFSDDIKTALNKPFNQAIVIQDVEIIKKDYRDEGYSNVTVASESKANTANNTVDVTFQISEGSQIKIGGIVVIGSEAFSQKKVAGQFKDNHEGDNYKPEMLDSDIKAVEDFYHDEGYLKAVVLDHKEKMSLEHKKVYITITVKEGLKYTTGTIQFQGNILFEDEELMKALALKKGDVLRKKDLDDGLKKAKSLYADKGYIYSNIVPNIQYDDDAKRADITLAVTEGQIAYVQDIKIVGNYKTRDYVIRRELAIKAGDKFEANKIRYSCQNLYNLGFFDEVNPDVQPGDGPGKEILVFRVKERKTGSISVGGGYSSVNGFIGDVKLEEANLFGKGQKVSMDVELGASRSSLSVGFTEPWLFNTPTSFSVNLFDTTQIFTTAVPDTDGTNTFYTETQIGGSISLGRRLSRYWTVFGTYTLQNVDIYNVDSEYTTIGTPQYIQQSDTTTSSITPRIVYDSRDNVFDPSTGWKHTFSVELAGGPLGFDNNFIKVIQDSSHFMPLPGDWVLGEHVKLGVGQGYSFGSKNYTDLPLYEKFFAGGTDTIRGYNERTVGPAAGGDALFVSNTELKHTIVGPLKGVLFFDAGNAWTSVWSLSESQVQYGAGLGVRLTIPGTIMAIRLDYGWPIASNLPQTSAPPGGVLHFNLGNLF
jgi:outer membrane protein insertion porin family